MEGLDKVKTVKRKHEKELLTKRHVVGVGIGFKEVSGRMTDQLSLVVMVTDKLPAEQLDPDDCIPREIEGVPTDVQAVGAIRALS